MKKYGAILADPPWPYKMWAGTRLPQRATVAHYSLMSFDEIAALSVADYAADDCACSAGSYGLPCPRL